MSEGIGPDCKSAKMGPGLQIPNHRDIAEDRPLAPPAGGGDYAWWLFGRMGPMGLMSWLIAES
jgi:hypothetical protein